MVSEPTFDENEVYDILRNERRRNVLRHLQSEGGDATVTIGDLADAIATAETGESPPPSDTRQSVYVSLHQTHLPKLDNLGVVEYDRDDRTVELRPAAEEVLGYLEREETGDETAATVVRAILVVAGLGLLATVGSVAGVPVLTGVGGAIWGTVSLAVVVVLAALYVGRLVDVSS